MKIQTIKLFTMVALLLSNELLAATTITYVYDDLNRVTQVVRSDGPSLIYNYDEVGNITQRTADNPDSDGDGLVDIAEINIFLTNIFLVDTDDDGISDGEEDTDGDGFSDKAELDAGTDPLNAASFPTAVTVANGDINDDGVVNVIDVLLAQQILLGQIVPSMVQIQRGDVAPLVGGKPAPDGQFNVGDLLVIQRIVLSQITLGL